MATGRMRFYSLCQSKQVNFTYVLPNDLPDIFTQGNVHFNRPMKTLYLLHGFSGNDCDWVYNGIAEDIAANYNLAIIMPTAGNNFYLDRDATGSQYGQFTGEEIVDYTRRTFGLSEKREDTLIAGLSMGGYGALHTAFAYPETFAGSAALSPALIIRDIAKLKPNEFNLIANYAYYREIFGDLDQVETSDKNPEVQWKALKKAGRKIPSIYLAIGNEDELYVNTLQLKQFFEKNNAVFLYEDGPGKHDWKFWNEYIVRGIKWLLNEVNG